MRYDGPINRSADVDRSLPSRPVVRPSGYLTARAFRTTAASAPPARSPFPLGRWKSILFASMPVAVIAGFLVVAVVSNHR